MLSVFRGKSVLKLARVVGGVLADGPASLIGTTPEHHANTPPGSKQTVQNHNVTPNWQPRIPMEDGSVQPLDPAPALFVVHQFLKQRGYTRCAAMLEVDAKEDLEKMKHLEGSEVDLVELLDEYWFLTTCEDRRDQMAGQNPFAEDLFRMLDAHMGINPWQDNLPKPKSYMRSAEEDEPVSEQHIEDMQNPSTAAQRVPQNTPANGAVTDPMARYRVPHPAEAQARQSPKQNLNYVDPDMSDVWERTPGKPTGSNR